MRLPWRRRAESDFSAEVDAHIEHETERLIADGLSPEDARASARKAFGNVAAANERFYESNRWLWADQFVSDVRYAVRGLRQSPAFLGTAVATLAVGLGLLTVAFTVFNAYVLRPFAVQDPERLYRLGWRAPDSAGRMFTWRDYEDLRSRTDLFDAVIADQMHFVSSASTTLAASTVSTNYFTSLRPRMLLGRGLGSADAGQPVAVLGERAWARLLAADPAAPGRTLEAGGRIVTVVGVVRAEFGGLDDFPRDIWMPVGDADRTATIEIVGRLRAGVTAPQAEAQLGAFMGRMAPPGTAPRDVHAVLVSSATANSLSVELIAMLAPVFAAFLLVLLTACFNVSNVMLARAIARQREIAVRLSLGASRSRIVRQLLTEGLVIAILAGAAALAAAAWLIKAGTALLFGTLPPLLASLLRVAPMPFDRRVFLFAFAGAAATALLFALMPAVQASRQSLTAALRGQRGAHPSASRLRNGLVVIQVALSLILVVVALVLAGNFTSLAALDLGYTTAGVHSINVRGEHPGAIRSVVEALRADPRIASVAVTGGNPLFVTRTVAAGPDGRPATAAQYTFVSPEYFLMLQIPIARGRAFRIDEARTSARVAIVSDSTARAFWPGADPIGQNVRIERSTSSRLDDIEGYTNVTVVGTVRDVVSGLMVNGRDTSHIYLPMSEADSHASALLFAPRTSADFRPHVLSETFRRLGYDPDTFEIASLDEMRQTHVYPLRAAAWIGGLLGAVALALSISGLYGVLSYTLSQRTREIGIRMALGATASAVVALVMRQSARLAGIGAIVGLTVAFAALRFLSSVVPLKEVSLLNAAPFAVALILVLGATALAAYQPARRATRVDPAETLRAEA
jgi:predicted permease